MSTSPSQKSENSMASVPTSLGSGSRDSASEPNQVSRAEMLSAKNMSPDAQADNRELSTTFGTGR